MAICQSRFSRVCVCVSVGTAESGGGRVPTGTLRLRVHTGLRKSSWATGVALIQLWGILGLLWTVQSISDAIWAHWLHYCTSSTIPLAQDRSNASGVRARYRRKWSAFGLDAVRRPHDSMS